MTLLDSKSTINLFYIQGNNVHCYACMDTYHILHTLIWLNIFGADSVHFTRIITQGKPMSEAQDIVKTPPEPLYALRVKDCVLYYLRSGHSHYLAQGHHLFP